MSAAKGIEPAMTPVNSRSIAAVGHDGAGLLVQFTSGALYRYPTAGREHMDALLAAPSAGKHMHGIKLAHRGEKVSG